LPKEIFGVGWVATGIHWFIMFHSKIWPFGSICGV
jgi:hypothetical protein